MKTERRFEKLRNDLPHFFAKFPNLLLLDEEYAVQTNVAPVPIEIGPPILHLVNFLSRIRAHFVIDGYNGLLGPQGLERIHAVFTTNISIAILILIILLIFLIAVTYFPRPLPPPLLKE